MFAVQAPGDYPVRMLIKSSEELWYVWGYTGFPDAGYGIPWLLAGLWAVILVVGYATDRFGPRRAIMAGLWAVAIWGVLLGLSESRWALYAAAFMMAAGGYSGGLIPITVLLCRRFFRRRATVIAAAVAIAAILGAAGAHIFFYLLLPDFNDYWATKDWQISGVGRWAALAVFAALFLIAAWFAFTRLCNRPEDSGRHTGGEGGMLPGFSFTLSQCLRIRSFWFIVIGNALAAVGVSIIHPMAFVAGVTTQVPGFDYGLILDLSSDRFELEFIICYQYMMIGFVLLGGWLSDRVTLPKRRLLAFFSVLQAIGIITWVVWFTDTITVPWIVISSVPMALGEGGRIPVNAAILAEYFGLDSLGKILGMSIVISGIATALYPHLLRWATDVFFDSADFGGLGDFFTMVILLSSGATMLGALSYWFAQPPRNPAAAAA